MSKPISIDIESLPENNNVWINPRLESLADVYIKFTDAFYISMYHLKIEKPGKRPRYRKHNQTIYNRKPAFYGYTGVVE